MAEVDPTRVPTGIEGFDFIAHGGLPADRATLLVGAPGVGKTVFSLQFALQGVERYGEPAVYVAFEESPADLRRTAGSFGWDLQAHEDAGTWAFVDAVPRSQDQSVVTGAFDLGALLSRIDHAVETTGAKRVVVDAVSTLFAYLPEPARIRWEMFRLRQALANNGVTSIITAERDRDSRRLTRHGVEAFVNDNVVILRNRHDGRQRSRTVSIAKLRAGGHEQGEVAFTIRRDDGIVVTPLSAMELSQPTSGHRLSTGVPRLDELTGGGFFEASATLVAGATGTGKTLTVSHFLSGLADDEEDTTGLFLGFEESRGQILRDATGWGLPLADLEEAGRVHISCEYPERSSLEDHLLRARALIHEHEPARVAVDSLTALQRIGSIHSFREFVLGLISELKNRGATLMMTATTATSSTTASQDSGETHVSSVADGIILLRYIESAGRISRALTVLKMRGTAHDDAVRAFVVDDQGMRIGEPLEIDARMLGEQGQPTGLGGRIS